MQQAPPPGVFVNQFGQQVQWSAGFNRWHDINTGQAAVAPANFAAPAPQPNAPVVGGAAAAADGPGQAAAPLPPVAPVAHAAQEGEDPVPPPVDHPLVAAGNIYAEVAEVVDADMAANYTNLVNQQRIVQQHVGKYNGEKEGHPAEHFLTRFARTMENLDQQALGLNARDKLNALNLCLEGEPKGILERYYKNNPSLLPLRAMPTTSTGATRCRM
ncbi:unnamed protein product [Vitrella brassicaformis CCMP3155]|uniref:Uncharacterized protein n=1 Tax=Vitrella brassicaformis (strain CCMP3155) TaxID=1169540 RepID=A0A0G4EFL4_VITBC|nr:unnamed protein product [Vitrella brassicaformis CCMP3155]|eukprot:CEL94527.1 unnamed protein product [Vitrella brassicaformis CCMP3155]